MFPLKFVILNFLQINQYYAAVDAVREISWMVTSAGQKMSAVVV